MNILYISYNGLTDFIGQAQVLPYLVESARAGMRITVISFESDDRRAKLGDAVAATMARHGMTWMPQRFRTRPPLLAKALDHRTMHAAARDAMRSGRFDMVHCRSYPAAMVGLELKRRTGVPLLFDMRGFWPDSRRDGGRWPAGHLIYGPLFQRWKRNEARLLEASDHIVSLTKAARRELTTWQGYDGAPVSIIPCCNDFELFRPSPADQRREVRERLNIPAGAPVLLYLGSLGSIYMLGDKLRLFERIRQRHGDAILLFVGRYGIDDIVKEARRCGVEPPVEAIRATQAERTGVPPLIAAADAGLCFYVPAISSLAVSPTKMGEYLACGVPTYANAIVGDTQEILAEVAGGHSLPDLSDDSLDAAANAFERLIARDPMALRARARPILDLPVAARTYQQIYDDPGTAHDAF
ncbi:glycosyltransferase [Sphingomonas gilva]|nr:glycosyltransferase [Sphingomonas gilva]